MPYLPSPIPAHGALDEYIRDELASISRVIAKLEEGRSFLVLHAPPDKIRENMLVIADGTDWNPGSGAGYYERKGGAWVKL